MIERVLLSLLLLAGVAQANPIMLVEETPVVGGDAPVIKDSCYYKTTGGGVSSHTITYGSGGVPGVGSSCIAPAIGDTVYLYSMLDGNSAGQPTCTDNASAAAFNVEVAAYNNGSGAGGVQGSLFSRVQVATGTSVTCSWSGNEKGGFGIIIFDGADSVTLGATGTNTIAGASTSLPNASISPGANANVIIFGGMARTNDDTWWLCPAGWTVLWQEPGPGSQAAGLSACQKDDDGNPGDFTSGGTAGARVGATLTMEVN